MPPRKRSDGARDAADPAADTDAPRDDDGAAAPLSPRLRGPLLSLLVFAFAFAGLHLTHEGLLGLPYYRDEAGYFIPAARDLYADGAFIPHSTPSNGRPPLVMAYLAAAWKLFGFDIEVARTAMLAVAALALAGVFALAARVANVRVAAATVVLTAAYPVFFAQSSLAHPDMAVAALTAWALVFYLPERRGGYEGEGEGDDRPARPGARRAACVALLALAALAKETAVLVPLTLFGWELLCALAGKRERPAALVCLERRPAWRSSTLLLACAPLALWFAYHRAGAGYTLGDPEYFRYNVECTLNLTRILDAVWRRLGHVTLHMNLWALTLAGLGAMFLRPRRDGGVERPRIAVPVQLLFAALILAHVVALSVVGGAVLARHMLPVLPLVVLVWVSTLWRRVAAWPLAAALVFAAFAYRAEVNPAHSFPWEENLAYRDFVLLHRDAARFLEERHAGARVLTSWPATDELRNPYYGYTSRPFEVFTVESFLRPELERAAEREADYDVALLYSTHGGAGLEEAVRLLGGRVVFHKERDGQWVAVVEK